MEWIALVENQTGLKLKHLHGDRGGEFLNNILLNFLKGKGIEYTFSNKDSPEQNGVAEARNKSTGRILRTLMLQSEAPRSLWGHAVQHATHLNNLFPHGLLGGKTPYEEWHKKPASMRRLRVWGCTAHVLMNKEERRKHGGKLGPVTKPCVLVGINPHGPGWLLLDGTTNREVPSSDVVFQEDIAFYGRRTDRGEEKTFEWFIFDEDSSQPHASAPVPSGNPRAAEPSILSQEPRQADSGRVDPDPQVRRSRRQQGLEPEHVPPSNLRWGTGEQSMNADELPSNVHACVQAIVQGEAGDKKLEIPVPQSWQEALAGPHSAEWMESMVREYSGILETNTLEAVPRSQAKNIVKCKWVYRIKRRLDGQPHFKSRLVAKGCSQKQGIDFFETWAPTARHTTALVHGTSSLHASS
jgi:hypothetical protein